MQAARIPDVIPELLLLRRAMSPDRPACCYQLADGSWTMQTWSEYVADVERVAADFCSRGMAPGDRLAIVIPTCREWELANQSGLANGAVILGIDPRTAIDELVWVLRHAEANWLVATPGVLAALPESQRLALRGVVVLAESPAQAGEHRLRWPDRSAIAPPQPSMQTLVAQRNPDDLATIIYTSGTTGVPKGIAVTHRQITVACQAIVEAFPELDETDTTVCWLPLTALFQRMLNMVAVARGIATYFLEDPRRMLESLSEISPTFLIGVPRFYEKLQATLRDAPNDAALEWRKRLKYMITGSAPLGKTVLEDLHARGVLVLEAYGVTENTVPMAANRYDQYRFGSVGKPLSQNELRFDADGEILVRSPGLFANYFREPPPTDRFTEDGFYRTGDCGYLDPDGFLYLTGRKTELIKTSTGRRIAPISIEFAYGRSPYLDQVVVAGDGRKYLVALVALNRPCIDRYLAESGAPSDVEQPRSLALIKELVLREFERWGTQLAPHERVLAVGILPEPLTAARGEITSAGKLRRAAIAANYGDLLEELYQAVPPAVLIARSPLATANTEQDLS